ncbi:uncharacterized protein LOC118418351 [Branchiostoma floridae]|uniref:Uncharacterized protein LOC118418351 n=1 Tax=Branchiostoma floridae TaxID=7739 RepID=A0A9J7MV78_BRAFL|nr:uncharacterized protein LOC118418351 [Branchiostoma floridae]
MSDQTSYTYQARVRGGTDGEQHGNFFLHEFFGTKAVQSVTGWQGGEPVVFYTVTVRSAREVEDFVRYLLYFHEERNDTRWHWVKGGLTKRKVVSPIPRTYNIFQQALCSCWRFDILTDTPFLGKLLYVDLLWSFENLVTRIMRQIDDRTNGTRLPSWYPLRRSYDKLQYFINAAKRATHKNAEGDIVSLLNQLHSRRGLGYLHQASYYIHPRLISLLLRHGADPELWSPRQFRKRPVHCLFLVFQNRMYTGYDDTDKRVKRCLRLFCRAMPRVPLQRIPSEEVPDSRDQRKRCAQKWNTWVPEDRWAAPCQLKHLCRCSVRRLLMEKACLPDGIFLLPLPALLHRYLNLEHD